MVIVIRKAARGTGFDIHAPEGHEEDDLFNVATLDEAVAAADGLKAKYEPDAEDGVAISDETMFPNV